MVIALPLNRSRRRGFLSLELVVACALLTVALLPIAFGFALEARAVRHSYWDAVIMEIVDGEMEVLAAGAWVALPEGEQPLRVSADAARQLPAGGFWTVRSQGKLRVEWRPDPGVRHRTHAREVLLP